MKAIRMVNYTDFWSDMWLTAFTFAGACVGTELIPVAEGENIIQIILSPSAEGKLDISIKFFILFSTIISCVTGSIMIYKSIRSLKK